MNAPKPQPPKSKLVPILETIKEAPTPVKRPFVLREHLTDRPFRDLKSVLNQSASN